MLTIEPLGLHWLNSEEPEADLCAHGGVRVTNGADVILDTGASSDAVSTGALHLLRTLSADHAPEHPLAEHLVPCCGHFMVVDAQSGVLVNLGCPNGQNWWVRHQKEAVELSFPSGRVVQVSSSEWCRAVINFADAVAHFYAASAPKRPSDESDAQWYAAFWPEWQRRRAAAPCA